MRPPPPLLLLLLLLGGRGAAASPADSLSQLPAPRNPKVHLYNAERVLSWEPVSLSNDSRPVVYQVQYKYASGSQWYDFSVDSIGVNCMNITTMECDFTPTSPSQEFLPHLNVSLRVRAKAFFTLLLTEQPGLHAPPSCPSPHTASKPVGMMVQPEY